jgi:glycerophosphoryl diester phosphodiesterase
LRDIFTDLDGLKLIDIDVKFTFDWLSSDNAVEFVSSLLSSLEEFRTTQKVFFCTFNVLIGSLLAMTQSKYPVTMLVGVALGEQSRVFPARLGPLLDIGKVAGFAGFVVENKVLLAYSGLGQEVLKRGYRLMTWGERNLDEDGLRHQRRLGVQAFVTDDVGMTKNALKAAKM